MATDKSFTTEYVFDVLFVEVTLNTEKDTNEIQLFLVLTVAAIYE